MPEFIDDNICSIAGTNPVTCFSSGFNLPATALPCRAGGKNCRYRQKLPCARGNNLDAQPNMIKTSPLLWGLFCLWMPVLANASDHSPVSAILEVVEAFVHEQGRDLPGRVSIKSSRLDSRRTHQSCQQLEAFLPVGGRVWGRFSVGIRCLDASSWTLYVPVEIEVIAPIAHAARPIRKGKLVHSDDISMHETDLVRLPQDILNDAEQAVGKMATSSIAAGQPLRQRHLRAPHVITRGQKVQLTVTGPGFTVSTEGDALTSAASGEMVQVRNSAGRIISGIARADGSVEVRP